MSEIVEILRQPQGATLAAYSAARNPVDIIRGPLAGGKTYESINKCLTLCIEQHASKHEGIRRTRGVVVRNTYPDLISTVVKDFREVIPESIGHMTMGHPPQLDLDFDLEDGTRVLANIIFLALDKPEDVRKIRGLNTTWIYVNEVKEIARANFDMMTTRADRYPQIGWSKYAGVFGDTNAWDQDHWLEDIAQQIRAGTIADWRIHVQPGGVLKVNGKWEVNLNAENPAAVRTGYYQKALQGKREDWIKVNLANEIGYSFDGKPVHPDYSDSRHVAPQNLVPRPGIVIIGQDFGLTPAAVFWQRQPNGQWWGIDELVKFDMTNEKFSVELKAKCAEIKLVTPGVVFVGIGDPAGDSRAATDGRTTFQVYRLAGFNVRPASTNDPQVRREALTRPLTRLINGEPGILLSPKMAYLRKALAGAWCYRRVQIGGTERYKDEAEKNEFSHVGEAGEYGLMDSGEHAIVNSSDASAWPKGQSIIVPTRSWNVFNA